MMTSTVNIVEVIDGNYKLNEEVLRSVISLAQDCDSIALISIIGLSYSGKTLLINFLFNYLESNERNSWPQKSSFSFDHGFQRDYNNTNPIIQLCTKPFILEDENRKIAIFLMDSSYVFTDISEISKTKLMEDIIGLFMFTSSTVICIKRFSFTSQYLKQFEECLAKNLGFIKSVDSFQELFFYIEDWDSKFAERDHLFGLKGGKDYINNESGLEFQNFFSNIECYLMPSPGKHINNIDLNFSLLSDQFIIQLSQMVKMKLLNIDEMQMKTKPKTDEPIKANELIELFESYINRLNADSNSDISNDLVKSISNLTLSAKSTSEPTAIIDYKKESITENNLDGSLTKYIDSQLKLDDQVIQIADHFKSKQNVFGDNNTKYESCATYSYGVQSNTSNTSHTQIYATEDDEMEVISNQTEMDLKNKTQTDAEMTDLSSDTSGFEILDSQNVEPHSIGFDTHLNNRESTSLEEKKVEQISQNITEPAKEITEDKIFNSCLRLFNEYRIGLENASNDPNFDLENGLSKAHNNEKSKSMSTLKKDFENKIPSELYKYYRKQLSHEMDIIKDEIKKANDEQINKLHNQYELQMNVSTQLYDKEMKASFECHLKLSTQTLNLTKIHNKSKQISIESFENEVKQIIGFNMNLSKEFSNKLQNELNVRKNNYEKAFGLIKSYINDWNNYYNKYRYISSDRLLEIQKSLSEKISLSFDKLNDHELKQIIVNTLENIFVSIQKRNENINDQEIELSEDMVDFVFNLFCERLNWKLKSGLFSYNDVKQMYQKLLEHTLQIMITDCDFKEYQNHLNEKCEKDLKNRAKLNFNKITSEYLKISANVKSVLQKARDEAINKYYSEMERTLSEKPFYTRNEFETISSRLSKDALKLHEKLVKSLKSDLNQDFYDFSVSDNITNINKKIVIHKEKFAKQNEKNAPNVSSIAIYFGRQHLSAANYDKEIQSILDKNENKLRPNSIAFSNEILFGSEAKAHNEGFHSDKDSFDKNFDIKKLITKYRKSISRDKLNCYPFEFEFVGEKLRIKVNNNSKEHYISIESLIALQVLDIKLDAEKQLGNRVTNAVLTVPTHYNLRQRNAFRDVAKIAGFEEVWVLSEINAAAISYATHINRVNNHSMSTVFFVVINELECDAAVCSIKDLDIQYKSYFHQNLISDIQNTSLYKNLKKNMFSFINYLRNVKEKSLDDKFTKALKSLFDRTIHSASMEPKYIDNTVILGKSFLMDLVNECTADYFGSNSKYSCDPIDMITNGSAVFCETITGNQFKTLNISEVSFYPYYYSISGNYIIEKKIALLAKNKLLPDGWSKTFHPPHSHNLPLKISIFQEQTLVSEYQIKSLPPPQSYRNPWHFHEINFRIDQLGEIRLISKLLSSDTKIGHELNLIETKLGLTEEEIIEEHNFIASIELQIKGKQKLIDENSAIIQAKKDLETYYLEVKKSVESNSSLRGLKRKKVIKELEITLKLLKSSNIDIKSFAHQKLQLQQIFEIL